MTVDDQERQCLSFRLLGSQEAVSSFGHPYIRRLCYQIPQEWNNGKIHVHLYIMHSKFSNNLHLKLCINPRHIFVL